MSVTLPSSGQIGFEFLELEPPQFDCFLWDVETVSITPIADETINRNSDGDEVGVTLADVKLQIAGSWKVDANCNPVCLGDFVRAKGTGHSYFDDTDPTPETMWFRVAQANVSTLGKGKPQVQDVVLVYAPALQKLEVASTVSLVDKDSAP